MSEQKIRCPWGLGDKTRQDCGNCKYSNLGDCPPGAYFVWEPVNIEAYREYLKTEESVGGEKKR